MIDFLLNKTVDHISGHQCRTIETMEEILRENRGKS